MTVEGSHVAVEVAILGSMPFTATPVAMQPSPALKLNEAPLQLESSQPTKGALQVITGLLHVHSEQLAGTVDASKNRLGVDWSGQTAGPLSTAVELKYVGTHGAGMGARHTPVTLPPHRFAGGPPPWPPIPDPPSPPIGR
jgi:hypothetical protein